MDRVLSGVGSFLGGVSVKAGISVKAGGEAWKRTEDRLRSSAVCRVVWNQDAPHDRFSKPFNVFDVEGTFKRRGVWQPQLSR